MTTDEEAAAALKAEATLSLRAGHAAAAETFTADKYPIHPKVSAWKNHLTTPDFRGILFLSPEERHPNES